MPTGYTADVESGKVTEFRTFALRCARAMGACIMQRDDPFGDEPKHREPTDYHAKRVVEARVRLKHLGSLTLEAVEREAAAAYEEAMARHEEGAVREREENARFDAMAAEVMVWNPPTAQHHGLKEFMLEQLHISRHDYYTSAKYAPKRLSGSNWLDEELQKARRDLAYNVEQAAQEVERCASSNAWIDALYASLNEPARTP